MAAYFGKVTAKGQITLPKQVREGLRIKTGDYLEMEMRGRELIVRQATGRADGLLLREYTAPYAVQSADLGRLRKRLSGLPVSLNDEVRAARDEEQ